MEINADTARIPLEVNEESALQFSEKYADQEASKEKVVRADEFDPDAAAKVICDNDISFIVSGTGTGKSSTLPLTLVKLLTDRGEAVKIASSQPRRSAAVSLASRVSDLRKEKVGASVGYWIRGDSCGKVTECNIIYMTTFLLFRYLLLHPEDITFTHIFVDEFHERRAEIEVLMALLRVARKSGRQFKLVLLSASADYANWSEYLGESLKVGVYDANAIRHPIHTYFCDDVCKLVSMDSASYQVAAGGKVDSLDMKQSILLAKQVLQFLLQASAEEDAVLFFLPGRNNIEAMSLWIKTHFPDTVLPIEWHSNVEVAVIQEMIGARPHGRKKVYLATDIAEVSLTLPDVVFVIDTGMTKKPTIDEADARTISFPSLSLLCLSGSSVVQREGRVGRVQQGFYFNTLFPKSELRNLLPNTPGIQNSPLIDITLNLMSITHAPMAVYSACLSLPSSSAVRSSFSYLLDNGLLLRKEFRLAAEEEHQVARANGWRSLISKFADEETNHHCFVSTLRGRVCQALPFQPQQDLMVMWGLLCGLDSLMILAANVATIGSPFYTPPTASKSESIERTNDVRRVMVQYRAKVVGRGSYCQSDIVPSMMLLIEYMEKAESGLDIDALEEWCDERCASQAYLGSMVDGYRTTLETMSELIPTLRLDVSTATLTAQLKQHHVLVAFLTSASYIENAVRIGKAVGGAPQGRCLFHSFNAAQNTAAATICPWKEHNIVVPQMMQLRYNKLLSNNATQLSTNQFNLLLLCTSHAVSFVRKEAGEMSLLFGLRPNVGTEDPPQIALPESRYYFWVKRQGQRLIVETSSELGDEIVRVRDAICCRQVALSDSLREEFVGAIRDEDTERLEKRKQAETEINAEEIQKRYEARGPHPAVQNAAHIPAFVQTVLGTIANTSAMGNTSHTINTPGPFTVKSLLFRFKKRAVEGEAPSADPITIDDVKPMFKPTHWSILRARSHSSVIPYADEDDVGFDDEMEEGQVIVED